MGVVDDEVEGSREVQARRNALLVALGQKCRELKIISYLRESALGEHTAIVSIDESRIS